MGAPVGSRRKVITDIGGSFGTRVLLLPLAVASSVILARALEPAGKGDYTTAVTLVTLVVSVGSLGFAKAATYYIARGRADAAAVRGTTLGLSAANGLLLLAILLVAAVAILPEVFPEVPTSAFVLASPIALATLLRAAFEGFLRGEQRNLAVNSTTLFFSTAFVFTLGAILVLGELDATAAVAARMVAIFLAAGLAAWLVWRPARPLRLRFDWPIGRLLLAYGFPYAVVGLTQNLSYRIDILFLQGFEASEEVGYYSIAVTLAELLWFLPMAVGFVLFPRVAAMSAEGAASEVAALMRWTFAATAVAAAVLALLAEPVIRIAFGEAFLPGVTATRILLLGVVANAWYQVLSGYFLGAGRLRFVAWATAFGLAVNICLNLLLIPSFGMDGAAAASAVSYTLTGAIVFWRFIRDANVPLRTALVPTAAEVRLRSRQVAGRMRRGPR
jgi:O-antigen/teichoic acid export membrane protein